MSNGKSEEDTIVIYDVVDDSETGIRKTIIVITELLYCINLVFSYPLTIFPANKIIESFIFHRFLGMKEVTTKRKWLKNLSRLIVVFLGCFLSITFEKVLDQFLGVAGAVLGITIILIVPTLYHYKVCATTPREKNTDILFMAFSFLVLCLCTYKGVEAWINDDSTPLPNPGITSGFGEGGGGVFINPDLFQKDPNTFYGVFFITDDIGD